MALQRTAVTVLALALGLASCGYRKTGGGGAPGGVPTYYEQEPNNFPVNANWVGSVAVGDYFVIRGHVSELGGDWFDGFSFYALESVDVEFVLTIDDPFADLDVCWYDPVAGGHVTCWETGFNPELGVLPLYPGEDFHLVVTPFFGSSSYTLEVFGRPVGYGPASSAPPAPTATQAPGKGPRQVPLEDYYSRPAPEPEPEEEPVPLARGRLIEVDGEDGTVRSRPLEASSDGLRLGPVSLGFGGS